MSYVMKPIRPNAAQRVFATLLDGPASIREIHEETGIPVPTLWRALRQLRVRVVATAATGGTGRPPNVYALPSGVRRPVSRQERQRLRLETRRMEMNRLRKAGYTIRELGAKFGISYQRAHQILNPQTEEA